MANPNKRFAKMRRANPLPTKSAAPASPHREQIEAIIDAMREGKITSQEAGKMVEALSNDTR